jgi:hypothetical protein
MSNGFLPEQPAVEKPVVEVPPTTPEEASSVAADTQALEQQVESTDTFLEKEMETSPTTVVTAAAPTDAAEPTATVQVPAKQKDEVMVAVEKILEEGLGDYYQTMPADAQVRFRKKGEEVAGQISSMVRGLNVKVKKVIHLIRDWLLTIPGVNKFFLEQEAKIKTDHILAYQQERKESASTQP